MSLVLNEEASYQTWATWLFMKRPLKSYRYRTSHTWFCALFYDHWAGYYRSMWTKLVIAATRLSLSFMKKRTKNILILDMNSALLCGSLVSITLLILSFYITFLLFFGQYNTFLVIPGFHRSCNAETLCKSMGCIL